MRKWAIVLALFLTACEAEKKEAPQMANPAQKILNHAMRGAAYASKGQHRQALDEFKTALRLAPGEAELYNNIGTQWLALGDKEKAWACYSLSLLLNPNQGEMVSWLKQQDALRPPPAKGQGIAFLNWRENPKAEGYLVYQAGKEGQAPRKLTPAPLPGEEYSVVGLAPGRPYRFTVSAIVHGPSGPKEEPYVELLTHAVWGLLYSAEPKAP